MTLREEIQHYFEVPEYCDEVLQLIEKRIDEIIQEQQKILDDGGTSQNWWNKAVGAKTVLERLKELLK